MTDFAYLLTVTTSTYTKITLRFANTDNIIHKLVTVFAFASACMTNTYDSKPGYAHLPVKQTSVP